MNLDLRVGIKRSSGIHQIFLIPLGHVSIVRAGGGPGPIQVLHMDDVRFDLPHLPVMVDLSPALGPHVVHEGVQQDRHEGDQLRENQPDIDKLHIGRGSAPRIV